MGDFIEEEKDAAEGFERIDQHFKRDLNEEVDEFEIVDLGDLDPEELLGLDPV